MINYQIVSGFELGLYIYIRTLIVPYGSNYYYYYHYHLKISFENIKNWLSYDFSLKKCPFWALTSLWWFFSTRYSQSKMFKSYSVILFSSTLSVFLLVFSELSRTSFLIKLSKFVQTPENVSVKVAGERWIRCKVWYFHHISIYLSKIGFGNDVMYLFGIWLRCTYYGFA